MTCLTKFPREKKKNCVFPLPLHLCFLVFLLLKEREREREIGGRNRKEMQRTRDQRSRSSRSMTIHGLAQSGDVVAFKKLISDNPFLLNERNPVVRSLF